MEKLDTIVQEALLLFAGITDAAQLEHVLRYWEQEFTQLKPVKRRGNRRYYQHHEVLLIRRIRDLLYDQGFTISGARNRLDEIVTEPAKNNRAAAANKANLATLRKEIKTVLDILRS